MRRSLRRLLPAVIGAAVIAAMVSAPTQAQTPAPTVGIRLVDVPTSRSDDPRARQYIVDHVGPGTSFTRRIEVSNDTHDAQLVQLYAAAGSVKDGTFVFGDGHAANDLTRWTTVVPATVNPAAGAKALATVTITVPADASPGERYGVVWAELPAAAPPGGGISTVNRVGIRIYLSVGEGGEPASNFDITTFEARRDADGSPVVAALVHNTGGRALDLGGELMLTHGPGGLSAGPFEARLGTTLGVGETEPVLTVLDRAIPAGPWDACIVLRSGTTERTAAAKITFPQAGDSTSVSAAMGGPHASRLPLIVGAVVGLVLLALLAAWLLRRRRGDVVVT